MLKLNKKNILKCLPKNKDLFFIKPRFEYARGKKIGYTIVLYSIIDLKSLRREFKIDNEYWCGSRYAILI